MTIRRDDQHCSAVFCRPDMTRPDAATRQTPIPFHRPVPNGLADQKTATCYTGGAFSPAAPPRFACSIHQSATHSITSPLPRPRLPTLLNCSATPPTMKITGTRAGSRLLSMPYHGSSTWRRPRMTQDTIIQCRLPRQSVSQRGFLQTRRDTK